MGQKEPDKQESLIDFTVPVGYREEARLDVYVARLMPNASRSKVQRSIKQGNVWVNEKLIRKPAHTVQAGDEIVCRVMRAPPIEVRPEPIPLDILYEDDHLLVINKAAGMVVHPGYGNRTGTLVHALLYHVGAGALRVDEEDEGTWEDEDIGLSTVNATPDHPDDVAIRPGIVHRLDKDTTGVMVVAKNDVAHRRLAKQFEDRTIHRRYLALVWGVPDPPSGIIDTHLGRSPRDRKRMSVVQTGKHALTHYATVEAMAYTALVKFRLETGRTHQIRVHAEHIGHPIFGDPTYGGRSIRYGSAVGSRKGFFNNLFKKLHRQALHAYSLGFAHPVTLDLLHFTADLPGDMQFVLDRLRDVEGNGKV